jgi:hypothetical protein
MYRIKNHKEIEPEPMLCSGETRVQLSLLFGEKLKTICTSITCCHGNPKLDAVIEEFECNKILFLHRRNLNVPMQLH